MKTNDQNEFEKSKISDSEIDSSDLLNELDKISEQFETKTEEVNIDQKETTSAEIKLYYEDPQKSAKNVDDIKHSHLKFHITCQSEVSAPIAANKLIPVLSAPYTNFEQIRYDFPMLIKNNPKYCMQPLKDYLDELVEKSTLNKDEKENLKLLLLKLELIIKKKSQKQTSHEFKKVWESAVRKLFSSNNSQKVLNDPIIEKIKSIAKSLDEQSEIISFNKGAELILFKAARLQQWHTRIQPFSNELEELIQKLKNILKVSKRTSGESYTPTALKDTLGSPGQDDLDFDSLSEIVTQSFAKEALPEHRIDRIKSIINILNRWFRIISSPDQSERFLDRLVADSTVKALKMYHTQKEDLINFFKAIRMAKLEIEHRYDEPKHDPFFAEFSSLFLSEEDWSYFPPIILHYKASEIKSPDKADLIDVLSSKMSIKVLVTVDDLYNSSAVFDESFYSPGWSAVLGKMALSLNTTFVLQFPLSHMNDVLNEIEQGIEMDRPALFCVFDGFDQVEEITPPFLRSAASSESRGFPLFYYNPKQGNNWAEHFSISKSTHYTSDWPTAEIAIAENDETTIKNYKFCLGDFLAGMQRYADHFLPIPRSEWHDDLVPLTEYIHSDFEHTNKSIPYILLANKQGSIQKVITTKTMCRLCVNALIRWNRIQELNGINNSHVIQQVEKEREILAKEMQNRLDELENTHKLQMEQSIQGLTNDIISNIAAGLLSDDMISIGSGEKASKIQHVPANDENKQLNAAETIPEEVVESETASSEDDDEEISFNDPYIDTPLCTSCNDCCNVNNMMFAYDENKQAYIKDPAAGTFKDLVTAAEKCPVNIIHPGKPLNPNEPGLDQLIKEAEKYN